MFSEIHEIVFHGNGGYDWATVYNMPLWLRRFTFEKIKEYHEKQREEAEKQQNKLSNKTEVTGPPVKPTGQSYKTKAAKV